MPLAAPTPWDAFAFELWSPLLRGGTVVVSRDRFLTPDALREQIRSSGTNAVWLTCVLFNLFVEEDLRSFDGLDVVITGGDRLSPAHASRFLRAHPDTTLVNAYGPVEGTIFTTTHVVDPVDVDIADGVPIGTPVPGTSVHVVDDGRLCGPDEVGEIIIGGDGLALGYLGPDGLDARPFQYRADHLRPAHYRSGDLGYVDGHGVLHFCGRADRQLKVRGVRIEPLEIEARLRQLLPIESVEVVGLRDEDGRAKGLAVFCRPLDCSMSAATARQEVARRLPAHLVPDVFAWVDTWPLTANGKLDEAALLELVATQASGSVDPADATADNEDSVTSLVARAFCEVLGRGRIPFSESFFDAGVARSTPRGCVRGCRSAWPARCRSRCSSNGRRSMRSGFGSTSTSTSVLPS